MTLADPPVEVCDRETIRARRYNAPTSRARRAIMGQLTFTQAAALLGEDARFERGPLDIVVADDRIAAIRPAGSAPAHGAVIDARNCLLTAGLINGHHHSHEHYYKGRNENQPLELWMNS